MQLFSWTAYTHKSHTWHSEPKHGTATYKASQQMVTSMCPLLSAANAFTFISLTHYFNFDSKGLSRL